MRTLWSSILFLSTFLVSLIFEQKLVEGVEWVGGALNELKSVNRMTELLDKLHSIPVDDPTKKDIVIELINQSSMELRATFEGLDVTRKSNLAVISSLLPGEMGKFRKSISHIEKNYNNLLKLTSKKEFDIHSPANREFAERNINFRSYSPSNKLSLVFSMYFGYQNNSTESLFDKIDSWLLYGKYQLITAQHYFYSDYLAMTVLGVKAYLINKFSWMVLCILNKKSFKTENREFILEHESRTSFMTQKLRDVISGNTGELLKTDPAEWVEKENYEQLTRLIQGYIVNEENLNSYGTCTLSCPDFSNTKVYSCADNYCQNDKVLGTGKIVKCEFNTNDDHYVIYPSRNPARRYDRFEVTSLAGFENYTISYGKKVSSPTDAVYADSWARKFVLCSYCFCLLDDKSESSDRYFSLREVLSDVKENKVVTGVRFVKKNRVMYLQIQQGTLTRFGMIINNSTNWKDVEEFQLVEKNEGIYFVTFDNDRKSVNLDDVTDIDPSYIVTGVKFSMLENHLRLEVRVSMYDFESGILLKPKIHSRWISNMLNHRSRLPLKGLGPNHGPDVSTRAPLSLPSPVSYNYLEFTHSDKEKDASQTTLPFFDTQKVTSYTPTPLSGVGLYHKGFDGFGGFLALKIFPADLSLYI